MKKSVVYKYPIHIADYFVVEMPIGAQVISVQVQNNNAFMWALVNPAARMIQKEFRLAGTGHEIVDAHKMRFVGTFQLQGGILVFHLFERTAFASE